MIIIGKRTRRKTEKMFVGMIMKYVEEKNLIFKAIGSILIRAKLGKSVFMNLNLVHVSH